MSAKRKPPSSTKPKTPSPSLLSQIERAIEIKTILPKCRSFQDLQRELNLRDDYAVALFGSPRRAIRRWKAAEIRQLRGIERLSAVLLAAARGEKVTIANLITRGAVRQPPQDHGTTTTGGRITVITWSKLHKSRIIREL